VVVNRWQLSGLIDLEEGSDERVFNLVRHARIQEGDVQHVVLIEDLP